MPDYQKPRFNKKPFNRGGQDRFSAPKQMHKANCSNCNEVCEVPFRPNGKKPVFCSNCFVKDDDSRSSYGPKRDFGPKREFSPRPSFNSAPPREDRGMQDLKQEMKSMNDKLARLIVLFEANRTPAAETVPPKKVAKKAVKKK